MPEEKGQIGEECYRWLREGTFCRMKRWHYANRIVFTQVQDSRDYAVAANVSYDKKYLLSTTYNTLHQSGLFPQACRDWRLNLPPNPTWDKFKAYFARAHHDWKEVTPPTAADSGYTVVQELHTSMLTDRNIITDLQQQLTALKHKVAQETMLLKW
jgi:hypothetical protein